jgi:hypothetical protein
MKSRAVDMAGAGQATARRVSTSSWGHALARGGLTARGIVYVLIAALAAQVAMGRRGNTADQKGALQQVSEEPFGRVALIALALGFAAYAAWRLLTMVSGEPGTRGGAGASQAAQRLAAGAQGVIYAALCVTTVALLAGSGGGSSAAQKPAGWTSRLMALPAGRPLVAAVGAGVIVGGLGLAWWGFRAKFVERLMLGHMRPPARRWVVRLGVAGQVSRGIVFALVGASLLKAAADYDPAQAKGLDDTLRSVADRPFGTVLLLLTAAGLLAFGLYSLVEARYRRLSRN